MFTRRQFSASLAATAGIPASRVEAAPLDDALDGYLRPFVSARDFAGVVMIRRGGKIVVQRAYGFADLARTIPNRIDSRFGIQSISKLITAGAIRRLETLGRLRTSDTLAQWLPEFPRGREVTIDMLLEHRSGLARDLPDFDQAQSRRRTSEEVAALVAAAGYVAEPGAQALYSNNGYRVLARVIERAGGAPYHDVAERLVTRPLGMRRTGPMFGPRPVPGLSAGCVVGGGGGDLQPTLPTDFSNEQGAASFYSTAGDLARLLTLHIPQSSGRSVRERYGHNGLGNGYMGVAYRFPADDTVIVMLGNIQSGLLPWLEADLEAMAFGQETRPPTIPSELPVSVADLGPYVGRYAIGPGRTMDVAVVDGRLAVNAGGGFSALWRTGDDRFFSRIRYADMAFVRENGAVVRIDWTEQGRTFPCTRVQA